MKSCGAGQSFKWRGTLDDAFRNTTRALSDRGLQRIRRRRLHGATVSGLCLDSTCSLFAFSRLDLMRFTMLRVERWNERHAFLRVLPACAASRALGVVKGNDPPGACRRFGILDNSWSRFQRSGCVGLSRRRLGMNGRISHAPPSRGETRSRSLEIRPQLQRASAPAKG